jgi:hypothetical protein
VHVPIARYVPIQEVPRQTPYCYRIIVTKKNACDNSKHKRGELQEPAQLASLSHPLRHSESARLGASRPRVFGLGTMLFVVSLVLCFI